MNDKDLEEYYRENLEERIIFCIKQRRNVSEEEAMRMYYSSKLCDRIHEGEYGIQYLDHRVLANYLEDELNGVA